MNPTDVLANSLMQNFNTDKKIVFTGKKFVKA